MSESTCRLSLKGGGASVKPMWPLLLFLYRHIMKMEITSSDRGPEETPSSSSARERWAYHLNNRHQIRRCHVIHRTCRLSVKQSGGILGENLAVINHLATGLIEAAASFIISRSGAGSIWTKKTESLSHHLSVINTGTSGVILQGYSTFINRHLLLFILEYRQLSLKVLSFFIHVLCPLLPALLVLSHPLSQSLVLHRYHHYVLVNNNILSGECCGRCPTGKWDQRVSPSKCVGHIYNIPSQITRSGMWASL